MRFLDAAKLGRAPKAPVQRNRGDVIETAFFPAQGRRVDYKAMAAQLEHGEETPEGSEVPICGPGCTAPICAPSLQALEAGAFNIRAHGAAQPKPDNIFPIGSTYSPTPYHGAEQATAAIHAGVQAAEIELARLQIGQVREQGAASLQQQLDIQDAQIADMAARLNRLDPNAA